MGMIRSSFRDLTRFERGLWLGSLALVTISFLLSPEKNAVTLLASAVGVTALIFISKGYALGQALVIVFAVLYGVVSFWFRYYGEMVTYLGMTAPAAAASLISWLKNPFRDTREVTVSRLTRRSICWVLLLTAAATVAFWFILDALHTPNLVISTLSVTTSVFASCLTFLRSPYYALGYAVNDAVLIALWVLASIEEPAYLPMTLCFVAFLANDLYGFVNWRRIQRRQGALPPGPLPEGQGPSGLPSGRCGGDSLAREVAPAAREGGS